MVSLHFSTNEEGKRALRANEVWEINASLKELQPEETETFNYILSKDEEINPVIKNTPFYITCTY